MNVKIISFNQSNVIDTVTHSCHTCTLRAVNLYDVITTTINVVIKFVLLLLLFLSHLFAIIRTNTC